MSGVVPAGLREAIDAYDAGLAAASPAELTGGGDVGYYLRRAALETVIAQRMAARAAASIHYGPGAARAGSYGANMAGLPGR